MTITVKLGDLYNAAEALGALSKERLPFKTSYAIARLLRKAGDDLAIFNEKRNALIKEFGEEGKDGEGNPNGSWGVAADSPKWGDFAEAVNEAAGVEVSLEGELLSLEAFGPDFAFPPNELAKIMWLIAPEK